MRQSVKLTRVEKQQTSQPNSANSPWELTMFHNPPSSELSYNFNIFIGKFCLRSLTAPKKFFKMYIGTSLSVPAAIYCRCFLVPSQNILSLWMRVVWLSVNSDPCWQKKIGHFLLPQFKLIPSVNWLSKWINLSELALFWILMFYTVCWKSEKLVSPPSLL